MLQKFAFILMLAAIAGLGCKLGSLTESQPQRQADVPKTSGPTTSKPADNPEEAIRAIYKKIDSAYQAEDVDDLMSYTSADYTSKDEKGKVSSREQAIKEMKSNFGVITTVTEARSDVMRVEEKDGLWDATVTFTFKGKAKANGKTADFETTNQSSDQWSRSSSGEWKCIRSITKMSNTKVNGKTVN